jgi:hypothetical protein
MDVMKLVRMISALRRLISGLCHGLTDGNGQEKALRSKSAGRFWLFFGFVFVHNAPDLGGRDVGLLGFGVNRHQNDIRLSGF